MGFVGSPNLSLYARASPPIGKLKIRSRYPIGSIMKATRMHTSEDPEKLFYEDVPKPFPSAASALSFDFLLN
jgi:hypothetical protein